MSAQRPPCECGNPDASWRGNPPYSPRDYLCETCWMNKHRTDGAYHLGPLREDYFPSFSIGGEAYDEHNHITVNSCRPDAELDTHHANALFIVRACNSHDALVEACKSARDWIEDHKDEQWSHAMGVATALLHAIAVAEGRVIPKGQPKKEES